MRWLFSCLLLALCGAVHALSSSGSRLLVVLEAGEKKDLYSTLWKDLEDRGYELSFESPRNSKLSLFHLGARAYDHLLLMPPKSKGFGPSLTPQLLLDFINQNGNILLALSGGAPTASATKSLLLEFGIRLSPDRAPIVVDHFHHDVRSSPEEHDVLLLPRPAPLRTDVWAPFAGDGIVALPRAAGQELGEGPLLAPVLRAHETAYSFESKEKTADVDGSFAAGSQLALITALQARNSARFVVLGSVESLQDKWFGATVQEPTAKAVTTVNRDFARQVTSWTFQETGVVKVDKYAHYLEAKGGAPANESGLLNPHIYRIKNNVTFDLELSEWDTDHYGPFFPLTDDAVQLEFTMLSPYVRTKLAPVATLRNSTLFRVTFTVPDHHGIFHFRVNYKRPFLSNVDIKHEVTVRHYAHNEYTRSFAIGAAWPWITGLWGVIGSFLVFVVLWLYSAPPKGGERKVQ